MNDNDRSQCSPASPEGLFGRKQQRKTLRITGCFGFIKQVLTGRSVED
jgi:hypothetical protein